MKTPQPGQRISFVTEHPCWVIGMPTRKRIRYRNVEVLPPPYFQQGCFFVASKDEKMPVKCIALHNIVEFDGVQSGKKENSVITYHTVTGSKDNVYTVIARNGVPYECNCPGFEWRKNCKHLKMNFKQEK